jgi:hypothetical protein
MTRNHLSLEEFTKNGGPSERVKAVGFSPPNRSRVKGQYLTAVGWSATEGEATSVKWDTPKAICLEEFTEEGEGADSLTCWREAR